MKKIFKQLSLVMLFSFLSASAFADELFVFIRNAENGLGQLTCKGQQRANTLPEVIAEYGKVDEFFASALTTLKGEQAFEMSASQAYTLIPTAKQFNKKINAQYQYSEWKELVQRLEQPWYQNKTVVVSWNDPITLAEMVKDFVSNYSPEEAKKVPVWSKDDFDSIYVVRVFDVENKKFVTFELEKQNMVFNNCPFG